jgi:uncharacterized protein YyaL (SSP411 family)
MDVSESAKQSLLRLHEQASIVSGVATDKKAQKLAQSAVGCSVEGLKAHAGGDYTGASMHAAKAAGYLRDSAKLHAATLDDYAPPMVLDLAHLGKAQELHQDYVNAINEGKKNGS